MEVLVTILLILVVSLVLLTVLAILLEINYTRQRAEQEKLRIEHEARMEVREKRKLYPYGRKRN